jgi:hypothetical protein
MNSSVFEKMRQLCQAALDVPLQEQRDVINGEFGFLSSALVVIFVATIARAYFDCQPGLAICKRLQKFYESMIGETKDDWRLKFIVWASIASLSGAVAWFCQMNALVKNAEVYQGNPDYLTSESLISSLKWSAGFDIAYSVGFLFLTAAQVAIFEFLKSNALVTVPFQGHIDQLERLLNRGVAQAPAFVHCSLLEKIIFRYATFALNLAGVGLRAASAVLALETAKEVSKLFKIEESSAPDMVKLKSDKEKLTLYFNQSRETTAVQLIVESVASLVIVIVVCCRCKCVFDSLRRSRSGDLNDANGALAAIPPHDENGRCCIISCLRPSQLPQDQRKSWTSYQWTVVFVVCTLIIRFIASVINAVTSWYALTDSCPRQPVSGKLDPCGSCQSFGALLWTWMVFYPHPHFAVILLSQPIFLVVALVCLCTSVRRLELNARR